MEHVPAMTHDDLEETFSLPLQLPNVSLPPLPWHDSSPLESANGTVFSC